MATLYLRNVPDDTVERLKRLAARDGMSVNAVAVRELTDGTKWVNNAALFATLPDLPIETSQIVDALGRDRAGE